MIHVVRSPDEGSSKPGLGNYPITHLTPEHFGIGVLFNQIEDAIIVADASAGTILLWNTGASKVFGYSHQQSAELCISDLMPERMRQAHAAAMSCYAKEAIPRKFVDCGYSVELPGLHEHGHELCIRLKLASLQAHDGYGGPYVLAIIRDITEEKRLANQSSLLESLSERVLTGYTEAAAYKPDIINPRYHDPTPTITPEEANRRLNISLTEQELHVINLVSKGLDNHQVARKLHLSTSTVKTYVARLIPKLGANNRAHAAVIAVKLGLIPPE